MSSDGVTPVVFGVSDRLAGAAGMRAEPCKLDNQSGMSSDGAASVASGALAGIAGVGAEPCRLDNQSGISSAGVALAVCGASGVLAAVECAWAESRLDNHSDISPDEAAPVVSFALADGWVKSCGPGSHSG